MGEITSRVEIGIEQGTLPRDDLLWQQVFGIIRHAHEMQNPNFTSSIPVTENSGPGPSHGFSTDLEGGPNLGSPRIDETIDPAVPTDASQLSAAQLTHANSNAPPEDMMTLGSSMQEAFGLQSSTPVPDFMPSEDWVESLNTSDLPSDPHVQGSILGYGATDAPILFDTSTIGTDHEHNEPTEHFDFDRFLSEQLDTFDY
jgi:hypothetical protein